VGARPCVGGCGRSHPPLGFDPWTIPPTSSHFTKYTIRDQKEDFAITSDNESLTGGNLFLAFVLAYFYCIEKFYVFYVFLFSHQMCLSYIVFGCD
jgi:hypothetical protein